MNLRSRTVRVYNAIVKLCQERGRPTTTSEIVALSGVPSTAKVDYHTKKLRKLGLLLEPHMFAAPRTFMPVNLGWATYQGKEYLILPPEIAESFIAQLGEQA